MNRPGVLRARIAEHLPVKLAGRDDAAAPCGSLRPAVDPRCGFERPQRLAAIGYDRHVDIAIAPDLFARDVDLDQASAPGELAAPSASEEAKAGTEEHRHVRPAAREL